MENIILTGYGGEEIKTMKGKSKGRCYLCKRSDKDESVYFGNEKGNEVGLAQIDLKILEVKMGDFNFAFLLCQECFLLLKGFSESMAEKEENKIFGVSLN